MPQVFTNQRRGPARVEGAGEGEGRSESVEAGSWEALGATVGTLAFLLSDSRTMETSEQRKGVDVGVNRRAAAESGAGTWVVQVGDGAGAGGAGARSEGQARICRGTAELASREGRSLSL